jgi:hypothetical protein
MQSGDLECPNCNLWFESGTAKKAVEYTCPNCGYKSTAFPNVRARYAGGRSEAYLHNTTTESQHIEINRNFDLLVLVLTFLAPIGTYFLYPLAGLAIGIATGVVNYKLTPRAKKWFFEHHERIVTTRV